MAYISFQPKDHFNTKLFTGNGASNAITGVGFQPDWVWSKSRNQTGHHLIYDAVRGVQKFIQSSTTNAEQTNANTLTSFDSDGMTFNSADNGNATGSNGVAWCWKMNGAGSSNTDGSVTSTVSVNSSAKMSIVKFAGTGANATVGHGLGVAPSVILIKNLDASQNWFVFHKGLYDTDSTAYMNLNTTDGKSQSNNVFNGTAPTSSVFTIGVTFTNGQNLVAYCFANTKGFFKSGVYSGNNSTNGPFINTGFEPALVIVKRYGANGYNWVMLDNKRSSAQGFNPNDKWLYANTNEAEANQASNPTDFLSNGFKLNNNGSYMNQDSDYLYMAWARESIVASNGDPGTAR